ncbi:5578_t:CDS:2 [Diversispora eburnea]|uniref:5578_t:CDS:1 n=1 Tax=Diversispora eburnea TaxID=1213867 RepID=A0A9N8V7P9_9GLOM|nr:5578_t:CDS:2 [Diversispora eburnea]
MPLRVDFLTLIGRILLLLPSNNANVQEIEYLLTFLSLFSSTLSVQELISSRNRRRRLRRNFNGYDIFAMFVSIIASRYYSFTDARIIRNASCRIWRHHLLPRVRNCFIFLARIINNNNRDRFNNNVLDDEEETNDGLIRVYEFYNGIPYDY